jgi:hypothetical protein
MIKNKTPIMILELITNNVSHVTWFINLAVKDMPNLVGTIAIPRFLHRLLALNWLTLLRAFKKSQDNFSSFQSGAKVQCLSCWP